MMRYDLCLGEERVGQATVERQGLYYKIGCRCRLSGEVRFRAAVCGSNGEEDLGLLVPQGKEFGLCTAVAVKKLGENLRFRLVPGHQKQPGTFVPLCPEEPFAYIERLKAAMLERRDGRVGVVLQGVSRDSSKPTGQ